MVGAYFSCCAYVKKNLRNVFSSLNATRLLTICVHFISPIKVNLRKWILTQKMPKILCAGSDLSTKSIDGGIVSWGSVSGAWGHWQSLCMSTERHKVMAPEPAKSSLIQSSVLSLMSYPVHFPVFSFWVRSKLKSKKTRSTSSSPVAWTHGDPWALPRLHRDPPAIN